MRGLHSVLPTCGLLMVLLSACGGGGGGSDGASTVSVSQTSSTSSATASTSSVSSASFKVRPAWENLLAAGVGGGSLFSSVSGVVVQFSALENTVFEGQTARRVEMSIQWNTKEIASPEDKVQRTSFFTGVLPFQLLGVHNADSAEYEVVSAAWELPDTAKIGTTGPFSESKVYRDASKTELIANARVDYSVEANTADNASAWVCLMFTERNPVSNVRTDATKLCTLVDETGRTGKGFKIEVEDLDSNGNTLGTVQVF